MVATTDHRDHLNALTDCIIAISRIQESSPDAWLREAAEIVRLHLAPRQIVSLWDGTGANEATWERVHLGVSAAEQEATERWHRQFMATLCDAGITPGLIAQTVQAPISGRLTRHRCETENQKRTMDAYWRRLGVESLDYVGGPLAGDPSSNGRSRTFFLSIWSQDRALAEDAGRRAMLAQAWRAAEHFYLEATNGQRAKAAALLARLTPGQRRVAELLAQGLSRHDIAIRLERSGHTIHDHTKRIYENLGVRTRAEFMALWAGAQPKRPAASSAG